uniref:Uncharacterized protein n=1 Tax=Oryza brachyantha TaxID=4533 RepID=J3LL79_ORYBR
MSRSAALCCSMRTERLRHGDDGGIGRRSSTELRMADTRSAPRARSKNSASFCLDRREAAGVHYPSVRRPAEVASDPQRHGSRYTVQLHFAGGVAGQQQVGLLELVDDGETRAHRLVHRQRLAHQPEADPALDELVLVNGVVLGPQGRGDGAFLEHGMTQIFVALLQHPQHGCRLLARGMAAGFSPVSIPGILSSSRFLRALTVLTHSCGCFLHLMAPPTAGSASGKPPHLPATSFANSGILGSALIVSSRATALNRVHEW